ncbi:hypothetical protein INT43_004177 [Umbelopsis isabellina]|uniref:dolichyl-phosphate-mannose--protein mannosyltransferase n=1 Tax=Mortierella isabellina TaxID=91625 RepID=A0A8H7UA95_MORIS|nr:hypothetical protein INT43_004177 [Umbelopsis isabellina]
MAYSLRYRKSANSKANDSTPTIFEPLDNYEYNASGAKKYRPRYYRVNILQTRSEIATLSFVTLLTLATRLWQIGTTDSSALGEFDTSYGVNQYLHGKFFIDRNPPLATMMYACAASLFGYHGQQRMMYMGQPFGEFPYIQLRLLSALLGSLLVPISYMTLKLMGHKSMTALVAASLFIFETGSITLHRHMLTSAPLGFFAASSIMMWVNFHNHQNNPYSLKWWMWQTLTGACIGCAMSISWTGALLLPLFWASSARQMWCLLGDRENPFTSIAKELSSRIWSMMIVPIGLYLLCFQVHFMLLEKPGDHDFLLSPELRTSINAFRTGKSQKDVAYGSKIVLRHLNDHIGYLHSHEHNWVDGSKQQQVTGYPYADLNNGWIIQKIDSLWDKSAPIEWVENNQRVRLEHFATLKKLHSHDEHAPLSERQFEVTTYGDIFTDDPNDYWTVEIIGHNQEDATSKERIRVISTKFRLKHNRGCYLTANEIKLPAYAKGQFEIVCSKDAKEEASTWIVENSIHPKRKSMLETDIVQYEPASFYQKMKEIHFLMRYYDEIIPNMDTAKVEPSLPFQWYLRGETMLLWNEMIGIQIATSLNPFINWLGCGVITVYLVFSVMNSLLSKRGIQWTIFSRSNGGSGWRAYQSIPSKEFYLQSLGFFFAAVTCTTLLTYIMPFNVDLSDSLLGLYFFILSTAVAFEIMTIRFPRLIRILLCTGIIVLSCYSFLGLFPPTYGRPWIRGSCENSTQKFNCQLYPDQLLTEAQSAETKSVYVDIFGDVYSFSYAPGEEEKVSLETRDKKYELFRSKTKGTKVKERYIGVQSTPAPKYKDLKQKRGELRSMMRDNYLVIHPEVNAQTVMTEDNTINMELSDNMNNLNIDPEQQDIIRENVIDINELHLVEQNIAAPIDVDISTSTDAAETAQNTIEIASEQIIKKYVILDGQLVEATQSVMDDSDYGSTYKQQWDSSIPQETAIQDRHEINFQEEGQSLDQTPSADAQDGSSQELSHQEIGLEDIQHV